MHKVGIMGKLRSIAVLRSFAVIAVLLIAAQSLAFAQSDGACPGFNSRLSFGMTARVTPGAANNVRSGAGRNFDRIGQIPAGGVFVVLAGPMCADGFTWWQVEYDGLVGWTTEGEAGSAPFLEPFSGGASGGLGSGSGSGGSSGRGGSAARNASGLPSDIAAGLATGEFGAGPGDHGTCPNLFTDDESNDIGLLDEYGGIVAVTDPNMAGGGSVYFENEAFVDATFSIGGYRFMPAICVNEHVSPSDAAAYAPDGSYYEADIFVLDGWLSQVMIPFWGYAQPGIWTLQVYGFTFYVNLFQPYEPTTFTNTTGFEVDEFVLAGYDPYDRVKIMSYDGEVVEVQLDANGNGYGAFSQPSISLFAVVPESSGYIDTYFGIGVGLPSPYYRYIIPPNYAASILYDLFWNGIETDLESWTCPGAAPIQLESYGSAITTYDGLEIYDEPTFNSSIVGVYSSSDVIELFDGVECADGAVWWPVNPTINGEYIVGWVAESVDGEYLLAPY
jgi:hypothetical protein